jgi:uncharacterized membrane protein
LLKYFLRGVLVLAPLGITLYVLWSAVAAVDALLPSRIPGVGLVVVIATITAVGYLTTSVIGGGAVRLIDRAMARVPLVRLLYGSVRDLVKAVAGEERSFDKPVVIELPGVGKLLGFVTADAVSLDPSGDDVAVYLPQAYNFAGNLLLVPRRSVRHLDVPSADVLSFVISGGVSGPALRGGPSGHSRPDGA